MHKPDLGPNLRDRRRAATYQELHHAAAELSLEGGLSAATIDAITQRTGVSRRTFFNYYATKEDAILGITSPSVTQEVLDQFFADSEEDEFTRLIKLVVSIFQSGVVDSQGLSKPHQMVKRFPELRPRFIHQVASVEETAVQIMTQRDAQTGQQTHRTSEANSVLVAMAVTVLRHAYRSHPGEDIAELNETIASSISTFRNTMKEIL